MTKAELIADIDEELAQIKGAIADTYSGQSYSLDDGQGRLSVTRAPLDVLVKRKNYLLAEKARLEKTTPDASIMRSSNL